MFLPPVVSSGHPVLLPCVPKMSRDYGRMHRDGRPTASHLSDTGLVHVSSSSSIACRSGSMRSYRMRETRMPPGSRRKNTTCLSSSMQRKPWRTWSQGDQTPGCHPASDNTLQARQCSGRSAPGPKSAAYTRRRSVSRLRQSVTDETRPQANVVAWEGRVSPGPAQRRCPRQWPLASPSSTAARSTVSFASWCCSSRSNVRSARVAAALSTFASTKRSSSSVRFTLRSGHGGASP
jgi:hypothetical protein